MTTILTGNCLDILPTLPADSVQCCVTSPPYFGLRDYGNDEQIGLESTPEAFVAKLVEVFREVRRVLREDGTLWLNLGDSYSTHAAGKCHDPMKTSGLAGVKTQDVARSLKANQEAYRNSALPEKNLIGIPWRVAFALQADGWYLRQDIIWHKPNPMPESVTDRCTKAHEYIFLLTKSARYFYDAEAVKEKSSGCAGGKFGTGGKEVGRLRQDAGRERPEDNGTRNRHSVWTVATQPFSGAHFAAFPPDLIKPCIMAGTRPGDTVLDPFGGSGTTGMVATELGRKSIIIELNPEYAAIANKRTNVTFGLPL
jgi:DNA modification methylase